MPDIYTAATCLVLMLVTWLYSRILKRLRRVYEPRWVWLTVVIGNTIVGTAVAVRIFALPLPDYPAATLLVWGFWQWLWHFAAGGFPIVAWQVLDDREALEAALRATLQGRKV